MSNEYKYGKSLVVVNVATVIILLILISTWGRFIPPFSDDVFKTECVAFKTNVPTPVGYTTYRDLYNEVYKKLNFTLNTDGDLCKTQPNVLPLISTVSCPVLFDEWLNIWNNYKVRKGGAIKEIPAALKENFTLTGRTRLSYAFYNEILTSTTRVWTTASINDYIKRAGSGAFKSFTYGAESIGSGKRTMLTMGYMPRPTVEEKTSLKWVLESLDVAATAYPPRGHGLVVGSLNPWVEAILLHHGASHLTTVEYGKLIITDDRIDYLSPKTFAAGWARAPKFDFASSYSSLEHSGLGRFGDAIDAFGDLKEVQKVRCVLKMGGFFYLAIPNGADELVFNAHRIYGAVRWPMMMAGFRLKGIFWTNGTFDVTSYWRRPADGHFMQLTLVLQKV